ncbi:isoprenyl transferase [Leuconostocaceae bacterium ESL0723]|nr:isoprenyl transferase [Leuconostocaceae bacterium ESL0723]
MAFFNKRENSGKNSATLKIPDHLAIIMDGNGRWAKKRLLPRSAGHKAGMDNVKAITQAASDLGVKVLTLYAFSTENWRRPDNEVSFLMKLPVIFFNDFVPDLVAQNVRVTTMGDLSQLPDATQAAIADAVEKTADNTGMFLNFAINYGGQAEIVQAAKQIATAIVKGELSPADVDQETFEAHLDTAPLGQWASPDLMIRTSGELRLSNFLPYQAAYCELYFTDTLWPDFDQAALLVAIKDYTSRDRRYGGL